MPEHRGPLSHLPGQHQHPQGAPGCHPARPGNRAPAPLLPLPGHPPRAGQPDREEPRLLQGPAPARLQPARRAHPPHAHAAEPGANGPDHLHVQSQRARPVPALLRSDDLRPPHLESGGVHLQHAAGRRGAKRGARAPRSHPERVHGQVRVPRAPNPRADGGAEAAPSQAGASGRARPGGPGRGRGRRRARGRRRWGGWHGPQGRRGRGGRRARRAIGGGCEAREPVHRGGLREGGRERDQRLPEPGQNARPGDEDARVEHHELQPHAAKSGASHADPPSGSDERGGAGHCPAPVVGYPVPPDIRSKRGRNNRSVRPLRHHLLRPGPGELPRGFRLQHGLAFRRAANVLVPGADPCPSAGFSGHVPPVRRRAGCIPRGAQAGRAGQPHHPRRLPGPTLVPAPLRFSCKIHAVRVGPAGAARPPHGGVPREHARKPEPRGLHPPDARSFQGPVRREA